MAYQYPGAHQQQQPYGAPGYNGGPPAAQNGSYGYGGYQQPQPQQHAQAGPSSYAAYGDYGQSEARPRGYPAAAPPQHYQQPAPAPVPVPVQQAQLSQPPYNFENDPTVFRNYLNHELRSLTFNSKPIINGLTILAGDHAARMAPVVAQCLEDHIRQVRLSLSFLRKRSTGTGSGHP